MALLPGGDTAHPPLHLQHEGSSGRKPLPRGSTLVGLGGWASPGGDSTGTCGPRLTFQSSTASSRKMRIPTSRLMAMIHPTT